MTSHPNTVVGGTSGLGGGALVIYVLDLINVHVDNYAAVAIAGAATAVALFIGRNGIAGAWNRILHGKPQIT